MAKFRKTNVARLYVRHQKGCPREHADDDGRCRCAPSYRANRRHAVTGKPEWSPTSKDRAEVLTWMGTGEKGRETVREHAARGPLFGALAKRWMEGVEQGAIGKRKGRKGSAYSETTLAGYRRSLENTLAPLTFTDPATDAAERPEPSEFEQRPAELITERDWQAWADRLAREGLSRSRIANHIAVASAVYGWASRPTRRIVPRNPLLAVELPPNDEQPRMRVATGDEAALLLAKLRADDQVPYALAFYLGQRRSEISRADWTEIDFAGDTVTVSKSKSEAGTGRRIPLPSPAKVLLKRAWLKAGRPSSGPASPVSVMSGKLAERAFAAWGWRRPEEGEKFGRGARVRRNDKGEIAWVATDNALEPVTLHECRHTAASFWMAAGYTLKEIMEFGGWADLAMVARYVKQLPQPGEQRTADRLNRYLGAASE